MAAVENATEGKVSSETVLPSNDSEDAMQKSLLDGTYDEALSAQSFQDALAEWRNGCRAVSISKQCCTSSEGVCFIYFIGVHCFRYVMVHIPWQRHSTNLWSRFLPQQEVCKQVTD